MGGGARISPQAVVGLINRQKATVIDLRQHDSFKKGHIINAINIPHASAGTSNVLNKYKEKVVILICDQGTHSVKIMNDLNKKGYRKVYMLHGGIAAWQRAGLPLVNG